MTASRDPDRLIHAFLDEGADELPDPVYDAVRADIEQTRQRAVIGPWRIPDMNKLVPIGLGAAAVVVAGRRRHPAAAAPAAGGAGSEPSVRAVEPTPAPSATPRRRRRNRPRPLGPPHPPRR